MLQLYISYTHTSTRNDSNNNNESSKTWEKNIVLLESIEWNMWRRVEVRSVISYVISIRVVRDCSFSSLIVRLYNTVWNKHCHVPLMPLLAYSAIDGKVAAQAITYILFIKSFAIIISFFFCLSFSVSLTLMFENCLPGNIMLFQWGPPQLKSITQCGIILEMSNFNSVDSFFFVV